MAAKLRETYHMHDGLEQAVIDLVRVGSTGYGSGVRQLAARLLRTVPPSVEDPESFRSAVHDALSIKASHEGLRFANGELPTADDGGLPLAHVEPAPDGDGLVLPMASMSDLLEIVAVRKRATSSKMASEILSRRRAEGAVLFGRSGETAWGMQPRRG